MNCKIYSDGMEIGSATVDRQGLYYCVQCLCHNENKEPHRIFLRSDGRELDLGICPPGDQIIMRFPIKKIGEGAMTFSAHSLKTKYSNDILVQEEVPFPYLKKLPQAYLRQFDGRSFIHFKDQG